MYFTRNALSILIPNPDTAPRTTSESSMNILRPCITCSCQDPLRRFAPYAKITSWRSSEGKGIREIGYSPLMHALLLTKQQPQLNILTFTSQINNLSPSTFFFYIKSSHNSFFKMRFITEQSIVLASVILALPANAAPIPQDNSASFTTDSARPYDHAVGRIGVVVRPDSPARHYLPRSPLGWGSLLKGAEFALDLGMAPSSDAQPTQSQAQSQPTAA